MKLRVLSLLSLVVASTAGCAAPTHETWIGSNVGVTVTTPAPNDVTATR